MLSREQTDTNFIVFDMTRLEPTIYHTCGEQSLIWPGSRSTALVASSLWYDQVHDLPHLWRAVFDMTRLTIYRTCGEQSLTWSGSRSTTLVASNLWYDQAHDLPHLWRAVFDMTRLTIYHTCGEQSLTWPGSWSTTLVASKLTITPLMWLNLIEVWTKTI
jgi:hypothetical protein